MSEIVELLSTLKRELKASGLTYAEVAKQLDLSENSIKRLFSNSNCSLQRLEQVCLVIGIDVAELVRKMEAGRQKIDQLSELQEREIASDIKLLLVAICVLNFWTFDEIIEHYLVSEQECTQLLAKLDRLKMIELLPLNRFRIIAAKNFRWRADGPIQQFFQREVQPDFFQSSFSDPGEELLFQSGMLSRASNASIKKKMQRLLAEFNELHNEDVLLPLAERHGTSILLALRPWELGQFSDLRRIADEKKF